MMGYLLRLLRLLGLRRRRSPNALVFGRDIILRYHHGQSRPVVVDKRDLRAAIRGE